MLTGIRLFWAEVEQRPGAPGSGPASQINIIMIPG